MFTKKHVSPKLRVQTLLKRKLRFRNFFSKQFSDGFSKFRTNIATWHGKSNVKSRLEYVSNFESIYDIFHYLVERPIFFYEVSVKPLILH